MTWSIISYPSPYQSVAVGLCLRIDETVIAVFPSMKDIDTVGLHIPEHQELLVEQVHLRGRFVNRHRLQLDLACVDDLRLLGGGFDILTVQQSTCN